MRFAHYIIAIFILSTLVLVPVSIHQLSFSDDAFPNGKDEIIERHDGFRLVFFANEYRSDGCDFYTYSAINHQFYSIQLGVAALIAGLIILLLKTKDNKAEPGHPLNAATRRE